MKVRQQILDLVNNPQSRTRIALKLGIGEQMVYVHLRQNNENGRLTKMDAVQAIAEEAGVEPVEVLEEARQIA